MRTRDEALEVLTRCWPRIIEECRDVLGSELHYQAVVYHCLRAAANVPPRQIGMNVKMLITDVVSEQFKRLVPKRHENFRSGFEPIPDVVLFSSEIDGDFRRRNCEKTLKHMLLAIEIKASERDKSRLRSGEISEDIYKLKAHLEEAQARGGGFIPVMMVIDTAPYEEERMRPSAIEQIKAEASRCEVHLFYLSPNDQSHQTPEKRLSEN